jgi:hypothetical protein
MKSKEQILDKMAKNMPSKLNDKIRPYVLKAMEIYAKEQFDETEIQAYSSNDGEFLLNWSCFEDMLINEFNKVKNNDNFYKYAKEEKYIDELKALVEYIEKNEFRGHPGNKLDQIFHNELFISVKTAEKLNRNDVINADLLMYKTGRARVLKEVLVSAEIFFVLRRKTWANHKITLVFEAAHDDYVYDVLDRIDKGDLLL